mmetsp:Transcript_52024/g.104345  ORF Transcript_52024/g.104345 Transcript_52024/m.104345 type:complete len:216 (+) Transcript_52024:1382-2029(+)
MVRSCAFKRSRRPATSLASALRCFSRVALRGVRRTYFCTTTAALRLEAPSFRTAHRLVKLWIATAALRRLAVLAFLSACATVAAAFASNATRLSRVTACRAAVPRAQACRRLLALSLRLLSHGLTADRCSTTAVACSSEDNVPSSRLAASCLRNTVRAPTATPRAAKTPPPREATLPPLVLSKASRTLRCKLKGWMWAGSRRSAKWLKAAKHVKR